MTRSSNTYLTIVAKTMAVHVLGLSMPEPRSLLSGRPFAEAAIGGVVESDFFDWVLEAKRGPELVGRIAGQAARFKLRDVNMDVLKGLYESLIDPEQRHDLGEYYTPDWLAAKMCERAIDHPLEQRVLDPACGSGTFLFHAVRRFLAEADRNGLSNSDALEQCCRHVRGIDVHPVAAQIARVTYLLALGEERLRARLGAPSIPVYMGDSLQWNTTGFMTKREVQIKVPEDKRSLHFPFAVAEDPGLFDAVISRMLALSAENAGAEALAGWLKSQELDERDIRVLTDTYETLVALKREGRNHVWGFVARNLVRPAWLSRYDERADVIIGNPPWLSYRFMSRETQKAFKKACEERGIWAGGKVATHQDLSAYFFARCVELYFLQTGVIAFVMPYAAMSRRQFEGFRKGIYGRHRARRSAGQITFVRFVEGWAFSDDVQPLFPVPSCVLFGELRSFGGTGPVLPNTIEVASGRLPRRDATLEEAEKALRWREAPWPGVSDEEGGSPYRSLFHQGATMVPRVLCVVERAATPLGAAQSAPPVISRRTTQEKQPWKGLPALNGNVEAEFLRPLYLGESIAPYRLLEPVLAVVPWDERAGLMDAAGAQRAGRAGLASWLYEAERLWARNRRSAMSLIERWDYNGGLSAQFPISGLRIVYSKAGTLQAAAIIRQAAAVIDHKLYWARGETETEAHYLCAILNSETARARVASLQSRGQMGARDFDKVMLELPIPKFDGGERLHVRLAELAGRSEKVAAGVGSKEGEHFTRTRGRIRDALREDGVAGEIDAAVEELLRG